MIIECGTCHAKYNVDEKRIPPAGVRVRCHKCQGIIVIKLPAPAAPVTTPVVPPAEPPAPATPVKPPASPVLETQEPHIPQPPAQDVPPAPPPVAKTAPATTMPPVSGSMSEDDKKWHERAKRLAKALASDLVLYNQGKVEQGLSEGTLAQLLGSEIRRSWEYYCQQIPKHIVASSDYFREQLNKIVGKGKEIFK